MSEKIKRIVNCPLCRQAVAWEGNPHRPFCSERCQLTDLGNWASGRYVIASEPWEPNNDETDSDRNAFETDD